MSASALFQIPGLRLVSEANARGRWYAGAGRAAKQRSLVAAVLRAKRPPRLDDETSADVTIVRVAPLPLDGDNLARACKAVRDEVARWLCPTRDRKGTIVGDDRDPHVTWRVAQRHGGVRVYAVELVVRWWRTGEVGAQLRDDGTLPTLTVTLRAPERRALGARIADRAVPVELELDGLRLRILTAHDTDGASR